MRSINAEGYRGLAKRGKGYVRMLISLRESLFLPNCENKRQIIGEVNHAFDLHYTFHCGSVELSSICRRGNRGGI